MNDLLDYKLFKKEKFELNLERFNPKTIVKSIIDIFRVQVRSQGLKLLFDVKRSLPSPTRQGERSEKDTLKMFMHLDQHFEAANADIPLPMLLGD